jgi:UDP-N-acetylmuramoylalanine--D-glutamate ligase
MKIQDLSGKTICILGFGREGQAALKALEHYAPGSEVTIADATEKVAVPTDHKYWLQLGTGWLHNLAKFDVIIKSPGIPPKPEIDAVKDTITSGTQIFFDSIKDSGAIVIGITGSKGKSTTSTLIYEMLKAGGEDTHLIGNIGKPAMDFLDQAKSGTIFVQELSSYQLMDLTVSPEIAVVTSFFPEHLDYHGSLSAYKEAKSHIAKYQGSNDAIFYNADSDGARDIAGLSKGKHIPFSARSSPVSIDETHLLGQHNLSNMAGATAVAEYLKIPREVCIKVLKNFHGLPHRLQSLGMHHDIEWVDDAISTTPDSAIAALDALGDRVSTIILGGQDRGINFSALGRHIRESQVRDVIVMGETGPRIKQAIEEAKSVGDQRISFHNAPDMKTIVNIAKRVTPSGAICLLSTASPSYDMFKNFEEKGTLFEKEILEQR